MTDEKPDTKAAEVKADEKGDAKAEDKPKAAAKPAPRKGARTETADDRSRGSVLEGARANWVDGKPEKIADPKTSAEAFEGDVPELEGAETQPTPWRETNPKLDNRQEEQQVTPESWAPVPQQVPGPEVGQHDPRVDNRG